MIKLNKVIVQNIYDYDFQELKKFEKNNNETLQTLQEQAKICRTCDYDRCKEVFFNNFYNPLTNSIEETLKAINNSYHFDASQIFKSEEEYKENNKTLEVFTDLWNYESTEEDEESVFKHNVETSRV
ncbi:MAG TPA: hypothetical protein VMV77_06785 [Bacteroidales bacterium]|nr:hypothetical protein [Bacteroidales bacterium]